MPQHVINFELWWKGPTWLLQPPAVLLTVPPLQDFTEDFSNYNSLKRVVTWCLRYIFICRSSLEAKLHSSKLSLNELEVAENRLIKLSQERSFKAELNKLRFSGTVSHGSCISHLRPYLDENGLIRVGGRLEKSALSEDQKHPIILHHTDHLLS